MTMSESVIPFLLTALAIEITPGPNMTWLALLSATAGRGTGLAAVLGITLGLGVQALLAAFGVAAAVATWPGLYRIIHLAGVGFLVWLAWESWRDAGDPAHHLSGGSETAGDGFRQGLIANLLNPKALVFFVTILPGFLATDAGVRPALVLSAIYLAVATAVHLGIALAAGSLRIWLANPVVSVRMHRIQALALVGVAGWLLSKG